MEQFSNSKANLFKAIFSAFRNWRARREVAANDKEALPEFMRINELFLLEAKALVRELRTAKGLNFSFFTAKVAVKSCHLKL